MLTLQNYEYTVGCICALPLEMAALSAMLDEVHQKPEWQYSHDNNNYKLGKIGSHNVAIVCLPAGVYGTTSATKIATQMLSSFPSIKFALMVGIGGGVPSAANDIRLGDVVVSKPKGSSSGVVQYDYGKAVKGELISGGVLDKPPQHLLTAIARLDAEHMTSGTNSISEYIAQMLHRFPSMTQFEYPGSENDQLFEAEYYHIGDSITCEGCNPDRHIPRPQRQSSQPRIFYGTIGSGNQVIKDGMMRDKLARQKEIICFEMEAAGLMDILPCLVIRGICDYADSHKNKLWQEYAAATAAAYAKELLNTVPGRPVSQNISELSDRAGSFRSNTTMVEDLNAPALPSKTFMIMNRLYPKEDISLASFITDRRYPDQDALIVASTPNQTLDKMAEITLEDGRDFSVTADKNFSEFIAIQTKSNASLKKAFSKLFLLPMFEVDGDMQVFAEESRMYTLRQPQTLFKRIYENPSTRSRLQSFCAKNKKIHFVVGFRTLINARFIGKETRSPQFSRLPPQMLGNPLYQTTGERVYAICYRKVNLKKLSSGDGALSADSDWKGFWDATRGHDNEDNRVEGFSVEIDEENEELVSSSDAWNFPSENGDEQWVGLS
ncbi:hypothetical protein H072_698 [Dactylellina haptotyla CBS 200.50]|uniref:Nucleoside phosphorylase domain-containing protein n=1 Tax=Dactylellina haptotyla (strain CBS 200.50) TaxID=1284197 RepID=S8C0W1_DACHA|nr:hypothetical protein H072_698 [Dactylellina haptotyla CBS 200.50]